MAGIKRKEAPISNAQASSVHKKTKSRNAQVKISKVEPLVLEVKTDSDPIIESDTTEHSGDDDGISWPSDEEVAETQPPVKGESSIEKSVREDGIVKKPTGANDINGCKSSQTRCDRRDIADTSNSQFFQRSSCKAKSLSSRTKGSQTQR